MAICSKCGSEVSIEGQRFCWRCGAELPSNDASNSASAQDSAVPPFCGQCGAKTSVEGQVYCLVCGAKLLPAQSSVQQGQPVQPVQMNQPPQSMPMTQPGQPIQSVPVMQPAQPQMSYAQQTQPQQMPQFTQPQPQTQYVYVQQPVQTFTPKGYVKTSRDNTLRLIAAIVNIVFCSLYGLYGVTNLFVSGAGFLFLICLAWMIPMTVYSWRMYTGERPNTTTFAVCTLIFVNLISGILLLVSDKDD